MDDHDRHGLPWTDDELRLVMFQWGAEPMDHTAARVARSVSAVRARLRKAGHAQAAGRGRLSVSAVAEATGYTWRQILRGISLAGIRPLVLRAAGSRRVHRRLTEDQVDLVLAALGADTAAAAAAETTSSLAKELGCSVRTVQRVAAELGAGRADHGALPAPSAALVRAVLTRERREMVTVRLRPELATALRERAEEDGRGITSVIECCLRVGLEREDPAGQPAGS